MKKALKIIGNVILWLFVVLAACMTILSIIAQQNDDGLAIIFGRMPVTVLSDSMEDTINKGDIIICKALSAEEKASIKKDDIITFRSDINGDGEIAAGELNTHRVDSVREENGYYYYTTKGDNKLTNPVNDKEEVRYDLVVGKYTETRIGGVGTVLNFLRTPKGFLICIVIPLILFFLFEIYRFISVVISSKTAKKSAENEEEIKKKAVEEYLATQQKAEAQVPAGDKPAEEEPPKDDGDGAAE